MAEPQLLRLASHFPFVPKSCQAKAQPFMDCFSSRSIQPPTGDADAAKRGLSECATLMGEYDNCVSQYLQGRQRVQARAPEAYRT